MTHRLLTSLRGLNNIVTQRHQQPLSIKEALQISGHSIHHSHTQFMHSSYDLTIKNPQNQPSQHYCNAEKRKQSIKNKITAFLPQPTFLIKFISKTPQQNPNQIKQKNTQQAHVSHIQESNKSTNFQSKKATNKRAKKHSTLPQIS